ncbi:MAG: hypothetical protein GY733_06645 [bacterium]|nr:hypothetical protein [bacterium]
MNALTVTDAEFAPALARDRDRGLIGYVQVVINDTMVLDGLTLRVSSDGRRYLSYPSKSTRGGSRFPYIRPISERVRQDLQRQVFLALEIEEGAA